jgi:hypothetical protein
LNSDLASVQFGYLKVKHGSAPFQISGESDAGDNRVNILIDSSQRIEFDRLHAEWTASLKRGPFGSPITSYVEGPPLGTDRSYIVNDDFGKFLTARGFAFRIV